MGTDEKPGIYFIWPYGPGFVAGHENKEVSSKWGFVDYSGKGEKSFTNVLTGDQELEE